MPLWPIIFIRNAVFTNNALAFICLTLKKKPFYTQQCHIRDGSGKKCAWNKHKMLK